MDSEKVLHPGTEIELDNGGIAKVFPLGFRHLSKFTKEISKALAVIQNIPLKPGSKEEDINRAVMTAMIPYILENLLGLVAECVKIEDSDVALEDLPHWNVPPIIEAWLIESFGERKKWEPWIQALENLLERFTGKRPQILETLSNSFSSADIASKISTIGDKQDGPT